MKITEKQSCGQQPKEWFAVGKNVAFHQTWPIWNSLAVVLPWRDEVSAWFVLFGAELVWSRSPVLSYKLAEKSCLFKKVQKIGDRVFCCFPCLIEWGLGDGTRLNPMPKKSIRYYPHSLILKIKLIHKTLKWEIHPINFISKAGPTS